MAGKSKNVKNTRNEKNDFQSRQLRRNQIIFGIISLILILSMALALVKF